MMGRHEGQKELFRYEIDTRLASGCIRAGTIPNVNTPSTWPARACGPPVPCALNAPLQNITAW
jgi:hypothetical protein